MISVECYIIDCEIVRGVEIFGVDREFPSSEKSIETVRNAASKSRFECGVNRPDLNLSTIVCTCARESGSRLSGIAGLSFFNPLRRRHIEGFCNRLREEGSKHLM